MQGTTLTANAAFIDFKQTVKLPTVLCAVLLCLGVDIYGQLGSPHPQGPFAESLERRRAEQDLRALPLKQRQRMDRNLSDPRMLKQMNEDFLRIQAIRAEMVKVFSSGSTITPDRLKDSAGDVRRRATRLRTMLAFSDEHQDLEVKADPSASLESVNGRAFQLCLEISRFTGNPLFKKKGVITINHAREASESLDAVIALAGMVQKESDGLRKN